MYWKTHFLFALLALISTTQARHLGDAPRDASEKVPWELNEALSASGRLRSFNGSWINDAEFAYRAADGYLYKYNVATLNLSLILPPAIFEVYPSDLTITFSPDNTKLLIRYDVEQLFRHSVIAKYSLLDIETRNETKIHGGEKLQFCSWSPSKNRLAYVYDNNVHVHYEDDEELQLTSDGVTGVIYNGIPDWVYEEEVLSSGSAAWWSKDGTYLISGYFNDVDVKTFKYQVYEDKYVNNSLLEYQYPEELELKYPKVGTPNPLVALRLFNVDTKQLQPVNITAPVEVVTADHVLQNVVWINGTRVLLVWLNRRQNLASFQECTVDGVCREVTRLQEPDGWIMLSTPTCEESSCIFTYWIDDWVQVWNLNLTTGKNEWISRGNFTVLQVYFYDAAADELYYQATLKDQPFQQHVFRNNDCLSCDLRDTDGNVCRSAGVSFSTNRTYYILTCNGPGPSVIRIFERQTNREISVWENNNGFREYFTNKLFPNSTYLNVSLPDGSFAAVKLQFPPNFDQTKKYPMIVNVYGGPNSVRVTSAFSTGFNLFVTTNREVIYAFIDGRGTGNKGKKLLFSVNNNLGDLEAQDQIFVTKYLQTLYPFVDGERVGIWGWSYGGYMTLKTLEYDTNNVFQCGVSVAPVTSWLYYDTIYTERYMGLPTEEDNLAGYVNSSVFRSLDTFNIHDLLLIHGTADDNVHYQNSLLLAKKLQTANIPFDEMSYTDENHSISSFLPHLYNTIDNFFISCLNLHVRDEDASESDSSK
ncbi:venom dipeptidyl peptidase 4 [Rhagoletis pomonella]|uniref:venom dipeptidyl peptidase 4 n=1 Tax=Rhagoletis pomonella TaxID=28610 RepID=UPI00177B76B4|nr:venom dipeptidyl peptidase 4 [Rhagoletis pomonella]XP_036321870.1 venom dipeptidyl peptidase 4 [Rhagoletis pomonella]